MAAMLRYVVAVIAPDCDHILTKFWAWSDDVNVYWIQELDYSVDFDNDIIGDENYGRNKNAIVIVAYSRTNSVT